MPLRALFFATVVCGLLLGVEAIEPSTAYGQIRFDTSTVVPKTDPIYPILAAHQACIEKDYEDGKSVLPVFRDWIWVDSPAVAQLFPELQFASLSWSYDVGLTVAIDIATRRVVKELHFFGNHEAYGELLVDHRVSLRDDADAKRVWDAFCDIHHRHWKDLPSERVSASEWHLGISRYDQATSVVEGFKTEVTYTYYTKVLVDPETFQMISWESKAESSDERKIPIQ